MIKLIKILSIIIILFSTKSSFAEIGTESWSKKCGSNENKDNCVIGIKNEVEREDNKKQTVATAYIRIASSKQKEMNLIDEKDQTYKLSEKNKDVPYLIVNLPLNSDLQKNPLLVADKKSIGNLSYTHCNQTIGCRSVLLLNEKVIEFFKKGKSMSITFGVYRSEKNIKIDFPLKGFSKAYKKLVKS